MAHMTYTHYTNLFRYSFLVDTLSFLAFLPFNELGVLLKTRGVVRLIVSTADKSVKTDLV